MDDELCEPRVIYIKPEDVPVCLVEKDSGWKPPEDCHTKYGVVADPWDSLLMYNWLLKGNTKQWT